MEKKLNSFLVLSLREMTLRRIAVVLGNKPGFLSTAKNTFDIVHEWNGMKTLGRKVKKTVSKLPLPASLMKEMIPILKAVGSEILTWKIIHSPYLGRIDGHVEKLCWATPGSIDFRKTSEMIVHSDVVGILERFEMACLYCLEDSIPALWNELSEMDKKIVFDGRDPLQDGMPNVQLFLPYVLRKNSGMDCPPLERIRDDCFKYSALYGTKAATEYCFSKLPEEKKKAALISTAQNLIEKYSENDQFFKRPDTLWYLLSLMTSEEQHQIFMKLPCKVLTCFLDWPWQDLCLEIADVIWTFLPESEYEYLLEEIKEHIEDSFYYIPNFFQAFFIRSPIEFRKFLLRQEYLEIFFFNQFFLAEDSTSFQVIFENIDAVDKKHLLFSGEFLRLLNKFILRGKGQIVQECIEKAKIPQEERDRLKSSFENFVMVIDCEIECVSWNKKRKRFYQFLDGVNANRTEESCSKDKKLRGVRKLFKQKQKDTLPLVFRNDKCPAKKPKLRR